MTPKRLPDPSKALPRDPTGSYLHLKLKRFVTIQDLTMPYAKKTWQQFPYDVAVSVAPNARSSCRQCHGKIDKDELRYQLMLQCHKGCKNSAYFHADCIWKYPETKRIFDIDEFAGFGDLPNPFKEKVKNDFATFLDSTTAGAKFKSKATESTPEESSKSKKRGEKSANLYEPLSAPAPKKGKSRL